MLGKHSPDYSFSVSYDGCNANCEFADSQFLANMLSDDRDRIRARSSVLYPFSDCMVPAKVCKSFGLVTVRR